MKIKLLFGVAAVAAVMSQAVCANAAYEQTNNSYTAENEAGYKTVLIVKGTGTTDLTQDDVYYVDQSTSSTGFAASAQFYIKDNPEAGTYTMYMGGGTEDIHTETFTVASTEPSDTDVSMTAGQKQANADGTYNISFTAEYTGTPSSIKVTGINGTESAYIYYINNWTTFTGTGSVKYAVQIDNVPAAYKDLISVSLSDRTQAPE